MIDLDKAREWAKANIDGGYFYHGDRALAAAKIIQTLPDRWVDVEEVRKVTDRHNDLIVDFLDQIEGDIHTDTWEAIRDFMCELNVEVDTLAIPKLPTLADMTEEERKACQWMQARVEGDGYDTFVIASVGEQFNKVLRPDGFHEVKGNGQVTPLPDLPKLQWPGDGVVDAEIVDEPEDTCSGSIHTPMQPSEVPADELWLVSTPFAVGVGYRLPEQSKPWFVIYPNLAEQTWSVRADSEITLIHKLVPETHVLPEGMRLADHKEYGRAVTSPWGDGDDDYKIFFLNEEARGGADYEYAHESTLTFLDGEA